MSWSFSVLWYSHSARSWASEPRVLVKSCCNCVMRDNWSLITVFCRVTTCRSFSFVNVVSFTNNTNTLSTVSNLVLSAFVHDTTQILSLLLSLWLFFVVVVLLLLVDVVVVAIVIIMIIIISHDPDSNLFIQSNNDNDDIFSLQTRTWQYYHSL